MRIWLKSTIFAALVANSVSALASDSYLAMKAQIDHRVIVAGAASDLKEITSFSSGKMMFHSDAGRSVRGTVMCGYGAHTRWFFAGFSGEKLVAFQIDRRDRHAVKDRCQALYAKGILFAPPVTP